MKVHTKFTDIDLFHENNQLIATWNAPEENINYKIIDICQTMNWFVCDSNRNCEICLCILWDNGDCQNERTFLFTNKTKWWMFSLCLLQNRYIVQLSTVSLCVCNDERKVRAQQQYAASNVQEWILRHSIWYVLSFAKQRRIDATKPDCC